MTKILCAVFSAVLLAGIALAQDTTPPASGSAPQEPQTPATTQGSQQMPEPSTAQPPSQQQVPESQQAPQTHPTDQPPAASRQVPSQGAGQAGAATGQTSGAPKIAPGSVIPAQLTKGVDAKKAKTGDEVVAKVTQDMKAASGEVLVPKDTKLVGHVTEAQPRSKEQKESQVAIAFDRAVMKNGSEVQLPMSIQAIIGPQNNANAPGGNDQTSSGGAYSSPAAASGGGATGGSGRTSGAGSAGAQPTPSSTAGIGAPSDSQTEAGGRPQITGQTQGVVGISNLKLSPASNPAQGSVVSSDKNNVKLESGTLLLLKVNPQQ
jgi:hypothetical protein